MSSRETGGVERRFLHEIISTVASSLDLDEVLAGVVRLLSEASAVHACFVYLPDADGERLVLRAASRPYSHLVDRIALERERESRGGPSSAQSPCSSGRGRWSTRA